MKIIKMKFTLIIHMSTYIPITEYFHIKMYISNLVTVGTYMEM